VTESFLIPLKGSMHVIAYGLLVPTLIILLLFVALVIIEMGSLLVEALGERRRSKVNIPELLNAFKEKDFEGIRDEIMNSSLLRRQKAALSELLKYNDLPGVSRQALARRLLGDEELYYARITSRTDLVARLGPMFGLMATLIPLGPGLIALGQGDTKTLADSLLIAFDATVTGLAAAGVAYAISQLRKRWYEDYLAGLEALMESLLEVLERE